MARWSVFTYPIVITDIFTPKLHFIQRTFLYSLLLSASLFHLLQWNFHTSWVTNTTKAPWYNANGCSNWQTDISCKVTFVSYPFESRSGDASLANIVPQSSRAVSLLIGGCAMMNRASQVTVSAQG